MMGTILRLSSCNSSPPHVMDASAINLIIQTCKDLGSIKFSFVNKLYLIRSDHTNMQRLRQYKIHLLFQ
jgi:hypothetical protein